MMGWMGWDGKAIIFRVTASLGCVWRSPAYLIWQKTHALCTSARTARDSWLENGASHFPATIFQNIASTTTTTESRLWLANLQPLWARLLLIRSSGEREAVFWRYSPWSMISPRKLQFFLPVHGLYCPYLTFANCLEQRVLSFLCALYTTSFKCFFFLKGS